MEKECTKCGALKPLAQFPLRGEGRRHSQCNACKLSLQSCTTREIKRRMCDGRKPESQHSRMILESWLTTLKAIRAAIAAIASRHS